MMKLK